MQTEVPALPVVCSDGRKRITRKLNSDPRVSPVIKNHSACRSAAFLLSKRKQLHPLLGGPYKNCAKVYSLSESKPSEKNPIGQRVMSAKMLRVKQLQNQLTDAHYHLNELANENRLLKALQKRQDSALKRYEGTNAELPRIINSHHEELRVLQTKYKKLKAQHKDTCDLLKDKENELHSLQLQNKHLLQLSKDRNLGEREKLQIQVSDLHHRIKQQEETIQTLNRKLALESKSLKHQLNNEVAKHKEAQKHLHKTMEKLKSLESMLDNREKRLYYNGQLPVCSKGKNMASRSLTNLSDARLKDPQSHETQHETLPMLTESESNVTSKISKTSTNLTTTDSLSPTPKTETMASLQQVRKFRLQKSPHNQILSARERLRQLQKDAEPERSDAIEEIADPEYPQNPYESTDQRNLSAFEVELKKYERSLDKRTGEGAYQLPKELKKEFGYSTSEGESDDEKREHTNREEYEVVDPTVQSKVLHSRLTSKLLENADAKNTKKEKQTPRPFTEEELERFVNEKLKFNREALTQETVKKTFGKAECKAELQQFRAATGISESDSESDAESERNREQETYDFLLKNAPEDSETEDPNHPIEDFLKFDVNASESDSEAARTQKKSKPKKSKGKASKQPNVSKSPVISTSPNGPNPSDDAYDNGKQRLMDITKSWSELQEKIMKERETSENQLKVLESELEDDFVMERNRHEVKFSTEDIQKFLVNPKSVSAVGSKDDLTENIEQKLLEIDNQGRKGKQSRRNSVSQENTNLKTETQINPHENDDKSNKLEDTGIGSGEIVSEIIRSEKAGETVEETNIFTKCTEEDDNFLNIIGDELSRIDLTQEKLKNLAMENEEQMKEGYRLKDSPELRMKLTSSMHPDNFQKIIDNIQHESDSPNKEKHAKKDLAYKEEMSKEAKMISYNKEKLLAAMKAIDNNENVEFLDSQRSRRSSTCNRTQITENLYRGLPTHAKKKDDLMKELFGDGKADGKVRNGCTKLH